jgi:predicted dehydrogenase
MAGAVNPLRVGIVGAHPQRGWALHAHLGALRSLPEFSIEAVSARTDSGAAEAAEVFGAPRSFGDSLAMARDPEIDVITVTVKVPEHRAIVLAALEAGKHIYCEWPLGRDLAESKEMQAAVSSGQHVLVGLQGLRAPEVLRAAALIRDGAIGRPLVLRSFGEGGAWGPAAPRQRDYLQDKTSGASFETIGVGHLLPGIEALIGDYSEVDARLTTQYPRVRVLGGADDEFVDRSCADHLLLIGKHSSGCLSTVEHVGGKSELPSFIEVVGERGWIRLDVETPGMYHGAPLHLTASFDLDEDAAASNGLTGPPANVARLYASLAQDIREDTYTVPDFAAAVRFSELLDAIEQASASGQRQHIQQ